MSALVKRLRDYSGQSYDECTDTWLAADEIERLQRQSWKVDAEVLSMREEIERLNAKNARLREALKILVAAHDNGWHPLKRDGCEWFTARAALAEQGEML